MKTVISILIIFFGVLMADSFSISKEKSLHSGGRCTGSSSCSACSNCSGCTHCAGSGGTCGICTGNSYRKRLSVNYSSSKHKKSKTSISSNIDLSKKNKISKTQKIRIGEVNINRYNSAVSLINIYEKPSLQSKIIEKTSRDTKLVPISSQKYWKKVKVQKSGKIGYVYYKDVQ